MILFCGQDFTTLDSNCRIKFSPRVIKDFLQESEGGIVLHCLPEGALAVYPEPVYLKMRQMDLESEKKTAESLVFRRTLRRFGALSSFETISRQGRVTIPTGFREMTSLNPGTNAVVVGIEIGIEIWNVENWQKELEKIQKHTFEKGELEMALDLNASNIEEKERNVDL